MIGATLKKWDDKQQETWLCIEELRKRFCNVDRQEATSL